MKAVFRYDVLFDETAYLKRPNVQPRAPIVPVADRERALGIVRPYLLRQWHTLARPPVGGLKYPFLVPGAIYKGLWDWDAFFIACALPDEGLPYGQGSILNLLDGTRSDGRPAKAASPAGAYDHEAHPVPLQAQFAYIMARRMNDFSWVEPYWDRLKSIVRWYEKEGTAREHYFVWTSFRGNGIDNNPSVYGRPARSSAGIDLACWHYREYRAMARLSEALGKSDGAAYLEKADQLKKLISTRYWDQLDRNFYNLDCLADKSQISGQGIGWEYFIKLRNWASFFPLWARTATPDQAADLRARALDPEEFLASAGLRSHSALDPVYNNTASGCPSNWQGPVWGLSTFLTAYGLANYGYEKEALNLAERQLATFAGDIETNDCLHEFYHGDTGQPVLNPGFLSWDLLALNVTDDIHAKRDCTTLDLLDEDGS